MELQITSNALGVVAKLAGFREILESELLTATSQSLDALENEAVNYMYATFINAQGPLESAFYQVIEMGGQWIEGRLINPLAYAWRRERGFDGADSLGRVYHDKGIAYMEHSLNAQVSTIEQYFSDAVGRTITAMGGTP